MKFNLLNLDFSLHHCIITIFGIKISIRCEKFIRFILSSCLPLQLRWWIRAKLDKSEINPMWQYEIRYHKFNIDEVTELFEIYKSFPKNILSAEETIDYIINNKVSVARIGDGEELLHNILNRNCHFPILKEKLIKVMQDGSNSNCLVCILSFYLADSQANYFLKKAHAYYWSNVIRAETFKNLPFNKGCVFGDAYSFLSYFRDGDSTDVIESKKKHLRKIWDNRRVLFVINKNSPIVADKTEFCNVTKKAYIYGPNGNAFSEYDRMMKEIKQYDSDWLIYIEMGACATVMAYELSKLGYQALDMGSYYSRIILNDFGDINKPQNYR